MNEEVRDTEWYRKKFLYPNGTLKNKLNITDPTELAQREYRGSAVRALAFLRKNKKITSVEDLKKIHKIMFGWLYNWAGQIRDYELTKGETEFLEYSRIKFGIEEIDEKMKQLASKKELENTDYAFLLDRLNYLHPFREGNGRSSKLFLQAFAANHGQVIDYPRSNKDLITAQNNADINQIADLIKVSSKANKSSK
ncbi:cell division protein [Lactobacillus taiwanensis DSM 21401]|jgi:Protein involved in cell division|uniref:protein adenylyltransferase n=1 Tax=Lactobacillus taiwanensis TaxID=508451 RepID=A0A256L9X8_9LACO|nr:Fic family protein [Lactobacillus taiwanensis]KRM99097.1 cell division protein [Lactobacillus taiwanensis DSM 21401]MCR1916388.1 Fic family protein [Lactobacillus taiwanensis]OYR86695.1 cell filamentation protein Fic [Lactobacillus taiwanensis]OYR90090.1 cell filamentation protein Fic [Lactobacillus taiwanensis]OYR92956.1 cell filamentation protein Fic [Lactobacillus taiwanensis]